MMRAFGLAYLSVARCLYDEFSSWLTYIVFVSLFLFFFLISLLHTMRTTLDVYIVLLSVKQRC
jgi:hypothetical protein